MAYREVVIFFMSTSAVCAHFPLRTIAEERVIPLKEIITFSMPIHYQTKEGVREIYIPISSESTIKQLKEAFRRKIALKEEKKIELKYHSDHLKALEEHYETLSKTREEMPEKTFFTKKHILESFSDEMPILLLFAKRWHLLAWHGIFAYERENHEAPL